MKRVIRISALFITLGLFLTMPAAADNSLLPDVSLSIGDSGNMSDSIKLLLIFTILSLLPSILIMMTSFTRIVIVLSFMRNALGLQQTPPNQVLVGLALFLSLLIMSPVITQINTEAYTPYSNGEITETEFLDKAAAPIRTFMLKQTKNDDLKLFLSLANEPEPANYDDIKLEIVIPAFITSELRQAFIIGFLIYLPFLVIDMVVSSVLMSMGMMMLPPVMISLPFKIMLFVLVDGWQLIIKTLVMSFN